MQQKLSHFILNLKGLRTCSARSPTIKERRYTDTSLTLVSSL